jgi:hypothetical protein
MVASETAPARIASSRARSARFGTQAVEEVQGGQLLEGSGAADGKVMLLGRTQGLFEQGLGRGEVGASRELPEDLERFAPQLGCVR